MQPWDNMQQIGALRNHIMASIYQKQEEKKLRDLAVIAQKNQQIRNTSCPCFMFAGYWYTYPWNAVMPRDTKGYNRTLDISLVAEVTDIIEDKSFSKLTEKTHIQNMVSDALQLCRNAQCLVDLLPDSLWAPGLKVIAFSAYLEGTPLTQEEIDNFNTTHKKGIAILKSLYMMELLLAKVTNG